MRLFKHPIKKLTLLAAFGGGYVLGAKAGRERYEQIRATAQQVKDDPRVQQATSQAETYVREAATKVKEDPRVHDVVDRAEQIIKEAAGTVTSAVGLAADEVAEAAEAPISPLLADEVVYSTGPDIEETIDELADVADDELDGR